MGSRGPVPLRMISLLQNEPIRGGRMTDKELMEKAVALARECRPKDERCPRVGAVIAINGTVIGLGRRGTGATGDDDHAEMHALNSVADKSQLPEATRAAGALLPDVLHFDPSRPAIYPENGRALTDDVVDYFLGILTNGKVTQDKLGPHKDLLNAFPYVAPPHKAGAETTAAGAKH
jgi:hypothetical protein